MKSLPEGALRTVETDAGLFLSSIASLYGSYPVSYVFTPAGVFEIAFPSNKSPSDIDQIGINWQGFVSALSTSLSGWSGDRAAPHMDIPFDDGTVSKDCLVTVLPINRETMRIIDGQCKKALERRAPAINEEAAMELFKFD